MKKSFALLVMATSCCETPAPRAPVVATAPRFFAGGVPVQVVLKEPNSMSTSNPSDCEVSGERRGEYLGPVVAYVVDALLGRTKLPSVGNTVSETPTAKQLARVYVLDAADEQSRMRVVESTVPALGADLRSHRGLLIVSRGPYVDFYCVDVSEAAEVTLTLDLYRGYSP